MIAGVNAEVMKLLFPAFVELITRKAAEHRQAALLSGKATASDIAAGVALGRAIAAVFVARAGSDGMGAAVGSPALWATLRARAAVRGDIPWQSLETPPRPPMLPFFGNVRAWMLTPEQIVAERPAAPPATSSSLMADELSEVRKHVDTATREERAITNFWADGPSTPTPPRHWMYIAAPYIRNAGYSEVRAARAFALVAMALHDAAVGCWETKFFYYNPRPSQLDPGLKTLIGLPNFPSYTWDTRPSPRRPPKRCRTSFQTTDPSSRGCGRKPRSRGCTPVSITVPISRWARNTASAWPATP